MNNRRRDVSWPAVLTACAAGMFLWCTAADAAYLILHPDGKRVEGTGLRIDSRGDYVISTPSGPMTYPKNRVRLAEADKPDGFDQARRLVETKKYDEAIKLLEPMVRAYRGLAWDNRARELLGLAYAGKKEPAKAAAVYDELLKNTPKDSPRYAEFKRLHTEWLMGSGNTDDATTSLNETIATGDRNQAAMAQLKRGDMRAGQNDVEGAFMDYYRTVLLFQKQTAVQPEALFKAAECLEKLRDNRSQRLYKELVEKYPDSPFAAKAKAKLSGV